MDNSDAPFVHNYIHKRIHSWNSKSLHFTTQVTVGRSSFLLQ